MVSASLGSIRARAELELGLGLMFDPNNLLTLTIATQVTLTLPLNRNLPNYIMTTSELVRKNNFAAGFPSEIQKLVVM